MYGNARRRTVLVEALAGPLVVANRDVVGTIVAEDVEEVAMGHQ